jgi:hypothetical protein
MSDLRNQMFRDLREVEQLYVDLHWQTTAAFADPDMPGGRALNMLGPSANPVRWESQYEAAEAKVWNSDQPMSRFDDYAASQMLSDEHPVYVLEQWTRIIREEREQPTGLKATLSREVDYLRKSIDWTLRRNTYGELEWPEVALMAQEIHQLVRSMEDALVVGDRPDASASACFNLDPGSESGRCGGRLIRKTLRREDCQHVTLARNFSDETTPVNWIMAAMLVYFPHIRAEHKHCDQGGRDDVYRCRKCERIYTTTEYWLAVKEHYEREAG